MKLNPKVKDQIINITDRLFEDISNPENPFCKSCNAKNMCYTYYINIQKPEIKQTVQDILYRKKHFQSSKIKIRYEEQIIYLKDNPHYIVNNQNNNNLFSLNNNSQNIEEIDDFDYNSIKAEYQNHHLIREDFLEMKGILIDQDELNYLKIQLKIIKNEESFKYIYESSFLKNSPKESENQKYLVREVIKKKHSNSISLIIPKECFLNVFSERFLNNLNQVKKCNSIIDLYDATETYIIFDYDYSNEFNCSYPALLEKAIYDFENQQIKAEFSVLNLYTASDQFENRRNPLYLRLKANHQSSSYARYNRSNIYNLLFKSKYQDLRRFIIKKEKPTFKISRQEQLLIESVLKDFDIIDDYNSLNSKQKDALHRILSANKFCIIEGFPGTGKTFLLSLAIRILSKLGKKILISSLTNSALDHILLKLLEKNFHIFYRIGNKNMIHEEIKKRYYIHEESYKTVEEWKQFYNNVRIIASTTISANSIIASYINYDYCFIDEAAQLLECNILGPILLADKFVLVGDSNQVNLFCFKNLLKID